VASNRDELAMDSTAPPNRRRVLLVEDYPLARSASARELRGTYTVTAVASGEQALTYMRPGEFDVVLTDMQMPVMTGIELLELVRLRDPAVRRVLMSCMPPVGLHGYLAIGLLHAFLPKPFDLYAARAALDSPDE
jgi:CheY-like chemotaxis protein